ncbi:MAG: TFIIB-type zinc finger domain-containing protein [Ascidiaceihabitans sp.]|nr:TFIIB-type zinc finger domain-containing protein [Ascidiaceihabitans sp.]
MTEFETPPPAPVREHRFPCDNCGSDFRFDPSNETLTCDHCGNTDRIAEISGDHHPIRELDYRDALEADLSQSDIEETRVSKCPNCAAQVKLSESTHAAECPFCATPVVVDTGTHRHFKPRGLLPFALEEKTARDAMTNWLGSLWFAPSGLKEYARKGRKMQGIYVPYWTFDADTKSQYTGQRGTVYYETQTVMRDGKQVQVQVSKISWNNARGRVQRFFDDVLVLASTSLPKKFTDALEPWDLSALEPYSPEYLAGFRAEGYSVELKDGFTEARAYMDRVIERDVKFDIGGDRQRIHQLETKLGDLTFKHILLPVWLAAYKYRGKTYRFVVNGRTGQVQGERPYSAIKIAIAVIVGLLIAAAVGYGVALSEAANS